MGLSLSNVLYKSTTYWQGITFLLLIDELTWRTIKREFFAVLMSPSFFGSLSTQIKSPIIVHMGFISVYLCNYLPETCLSLFSSLISQDI